ncbi:MAG TPA: NAD(P)/FAD-dependent oxidoreductase [Aurantimonas sp.]|uniref:Thioredoxin reductase n=1 Tax=Aurantimonas marianensis TaxID=2920428 RepID=A0A9X2HB27_9HYPH|nr:NAD(P)/FAD-dependent oxidoreductase [Aurantimonas marianensis]MCP3056478.1 NAD(P)/FAD-dependent oxidoreductase [Aurantimonas marianensis]
MPAFDSAPCLDCLVIGAGPAGLAAALYLARFKRRFLVIDAGDPRAAWIPTSHNIPFFERGISGREVLARERAHARHYGAEIVEGKVVRLAKRQDGIFQAWVETMPTAESRSFDVTARRVLLATGACDVEPDLPDVSDAVRRGLVRYCPICDGYEAQHKAVAVIGRGARGLEEAAFVARTYSRDVTFLTLGTPLDIDDAGWALARQHGIKIVEEPVGELHVEGDRIAAIRLESGAEHGFDVIYSALGLTLRSDLAVALGADHDEAGALIVDEHNRTSIDGLYAAGAVVRGLDQIVVAMGHAAVAATDIHNHCAPPTQEEP